MGEKKGLGGGGRGGGGGGGRRKAERGVLPRVVFIFQIRLSKYNRGRRGAPRHQMKRQSAKEHHAEICARDCVTGAGVDARFRPDRLSMGPGRPPLFNSP